MTKSPKPPRLLFFVTEDWYFVSHRLPLAKAAQKAGYDVSLVTRVNKHAEVIKAAGIKLYPLAMHRSGLNPLRELMTFLKLAFIYAKERPDIAHHVAMKPVVYGSLAAWLTGVKGVVNALAGLGFVFSSETPRARMLQPLVRRMLKLVLSRKNSRLILQNRDDVKLFAALGLAGPGAIRLIRGSGVDPDACEVTPEPTDGPCLVVLPARMLKDKGVCEFVEAARILRWRNVAARFALVGAPDPLNPASLSEAQLQAWQDEGIVEYWGWREDMPAIIANANIVCLPSYREGLPKALLEAAACGRAMVATDVPGCREIVRPDESGWLAAPRDPASLADCLAEAITRPELRAAYGRRARKIIEAEFSLSRVCEETLEVYGEFRTLS